MITLSLSNKSVLPAAIYPFPTVSSQLFHSIWSLGVVVFQYANGLPEHTQEKNAVFWYEKIVEAVEDWDSDKLIDLLSSKMLKIDAEERLSARLCGRGIESPPGDDQWAILGNEREAPTERLSTSFVWKAVSQFRAPDEDEEAETRILKTATTLSQRSDKKQSRGRRSPATSSADEESYQTHETKRRRTKIRTNDATLNPEVPVAQTESPTQTSNALLTEKRPGYLELEIRGRKATIHKADFWLNATQILILANKNEKQRRYALDLMSKHTEVEVQKANKWNHISCSWVCCVHGRLLCEALKLEKVLEPILEYGRDGTTDEQKPGVVNYLMTEEFCPFKSTAVQTS
jgi:hypothetical protein